MADDNVALNIIYSDPDSIENLKNDSVNLPKDTAIKVPRFYFCNNRILLQIIPIRKIIESDLIIIIQASGYLANYFLLLLRIFKIKKIAFWGHGYNRQGNPKSFSEILKKRIAKWGGWWFAFTQDTTNYLTSIGINPSRITTVNNAVDTVLLRDSVRNFSEIEMNKVRLQLGINKFDIIALFCGSLYKEKKIDYLLEAGKIISYKIPNFKLIIIGSGIESEKIIRYSINNKWLIYIGHSFGNDKAIYFSLAKIFLNPGLVGLGILDAFAAGLPFITTSEALHSPEICYLENNVNGLILNGEAINFANGVCAFLNNKLLLDSLSSGALKSANYYNIENMVYNFKTGIVKYLNQSLI